MMQTLWRLSFHSDKQIVSVTSFYFSNLILVPCACHGCNSKLHFLLGVFPFLLRKSEVYKRQWYSPCHIEILQTKRAINTFGRRLKSDMSSGHPFDVALLVVFCSCLWNSHFHMIKTKVTTFHQKNLFRTQQRVLRKTSPKTIKVQFHHKDEILLSEVFCFHDRSKKTIHKKCVKSGKRMRLSGWSWGQFLQHGLAPSQLLYLRVKTWEGFKGLRRFWLASTCKTTRNLF